MSTIFDNFSVSEVNFSEAQGTDLGSEGIYNLIITPDSGFTLDYNNFELINPVPEGIDATSVQFIQDGLNVRLDFSFKSGFIMPSNEISLPICMRGFANSNEFIIQGEFNIVTDNATPSSQVGPYSNSGVFDSTETVLTKTVTASAGNYFYNEPIAAVSVGEAANYSISKSKVYNIAGQLTSVTFEFNYTYPLANVSGDTINIQAKAIPIVDSIALINTYSIDGVTGSNPLPIPSRGDTRILVLSGGAGAGYNVELTDNGGIPAALYSGVLPSTGSVSLSIVFDSDTASGDYELRVSGDLRDNVSNDGPDLVIDFAKQEIPTITITATTTESGISIKNQGSDVYAPVVFDLIPNYEYLPGSINTFEFAFKAVAVGGDLSVIDTNLDTSNFNPTIPDPAVSSDMVYELSEVSGAIDSNGEYNVSGRIEVSESSTESVLHNLNLDNIISFTPCETIFQKGLSAYGQVIDRSIELKSYGGVIVLLFNAASAPDKLEIIHGAENLTKKATTTMSGNNSTFDNTYGTQGTDPANIIPNATQASSVDQFIGSLKGDIPTMQTEFTTATGYEIPTMPTDPNGDTYQQIIWWSYTADDYALNSTATVRVTSATPANGNTGWNYSSVCCPGTNCLSA